ncbi:hypothetical protein [Nitrosomonas communis]|uniref:Uncharacterized protein n=1 Tax=Nitrosomonas communis TaxID=44574 RepID=A0A1I4QR75_9PROT|nr:hypothetical protein [Nitrosomonas communis]SFM42193.1 hypothetical protein SAMN05421863_10284 [Nitrosomonas communis]
MDNQHGNTGKRNAAKPEDQKATSTLIVRCLPSDKASWVKASQLEGLKLTDWVIKTLNERTQK